MEAPGGASGLGPEAFSGGCTTDEDDDVMEAAEPAAEGSFDPSRRLCPDGSCVGVIGADDRCNECGRSARDV